MTWQIAVMTVVIDYDLANYSNDWLFKMAWQIVVMTVVIAYDLTFAIT